MAAVDPSALPETCCPRSQATLWLGAGHAIYRGGSLRLGPHSGSVHCLAVGVEADFTVTDATGRYRTRSALIAPRWVHHVDAHGGQMLFCYLDAGSHRAASCRAKVARRDQKIGLAHLHESTLIELAKEADPDPWRILDAAGPDGRSDIDARVQAAIDTLRTDPGTAMTAAHFAASAHLSTSRFLHLFSEHAETSFRRYRLWARMAHVGKAVSKGIDLTTASAEAGFASPSHFSDAFRRMCGLSASALFSAGARIVILDDI